MGAVRGLGLIASTADWIGALVGRQPRSQDLSSRFVALLNQISTLRQSAKYTKRFHNNWQHLGIYMRRIASTVIFLYSRIAMASATGSSSSGQPIFDHKRWLAEFKSSKNFKQLRVEIIEQTLEACKNFKYTLEDGTEVTFSDRESVSKYARKTKLHMEESAPQREVRSDELETKITVVNVDCLEEAIRLKNEGFNPAVLNMASSRRPGKLSGVSERVLPGGGGRGDLQFQITQNMFI